MDSSKDSLKAVLLHNGNNFAAIPIAHTTVIKESYENFKLWLEQIDYNCQKWLICGDFKMIQMILGLQQGFTKTPCFICLWDSRARDQHFTQKYSDKRKQWKIGYENVIHESLVDHQNILLPPLHIKLGIMKQYVKALNNKGTYWDDDFVASMTLLEKKLGWVLKKLWTNFWE